MPTIKYFEDLFIWQESRKLANEIHHHFSDLKDYSFKDQIRRASVSVMNNIAEGFERSSDVEFKRFLDISKAFCGEVRSMLYLASDFAYIEVETAESIIKKCRLLSVGIQKLIGSLNRSSD